MKHCFSVEVELAPGLEAVLCALHQEPATWGPWELSTVLALCSGRGGTATVTLTGGTVGPEDVTPDDPYVRVARLAEVLDTAASARALARAVEQNPHLNGARLADVLSIYDDNDAFLARIVGYYERTTPEHRATVTAPLGIDIRSALILAELAGETDEWAEALLSELRPPAVTRRGEPS